MTYLDSGYNNFLSINSLGDDLSEGINSSNVDAIISSGSIIDDNVESLNISKITGDILISALVGDLDDIDDGTTYAKVLSASLSAGEVLLSAAAGDLDDVSDGSTYGKVLVTSITAGKILLVEATGDLDDIANGSNFGKISLTDITAGHIILVASTASININDTVFGNAGIQLQYNSGTPRAYVGDGSNAFLNFDGTKLTWKGTNTALDASGNLTATSATISGVITLSATSSGIANLSDSGDLVTVNEADVNALNLTNAPSEAGADVTASNNNWSEVTDDDSNKPDDNADVTLSAVNGTLTITGGGITLSSGGAIKGGQTDYDTGTGFFLGYSSAAYKFSIGNASGAKLTWDGTALAVTGGVLTGAASGSDISLLQATHDLVFSVTDADTIAWSSGTITLSNTDSYSIDAGNTGNMAALTYIYLDPDTSITVLQTTTTYSTAVEANKLLIGVAQNQTTTASYIPFNGGGKPLLDGEQLGALSVGTAVIGNAVITNAKINDLAVSKLTAGIIDGQSFVLAASGSGDVEMRSGISAGDFDNSGANSGFIFGVDDDDSDKVKFYWGSPTSFIKFDGTTTTVSTPITVDEVFTAGEDISIRDAVGLWGEIVDENTYVNADQGTWVDQDNPNTNNDGDGGIEMRETSSEVNGDKEGLTSFPSDSELPVIPTGDGITNLKVEIQVKYNVTTTDNDWRLEFHANTASFDETTVDYNDKPSHTAAIIIGPVHAGGVGIYETGWGEVSEANYLSMRANGFTITTPFDGNVRIGDEDNATPPQVKVRFTYKQQNGKIFKVNATDGIDDAQGTDYPDSFVGLAVAGASADASITVRTEGKMSGFTGLTPYVTYYLSNTDGEIQDSAASQEKIVGRSLSATELQIKYQIT